ncbi:site-specific integrase [Methylotenera sp.]|uniref:site-specific integrase n=1 Tax=Methylotenera sp. TaxID=2051956 RepID=UPI0027246061|nr:site-specific integrase [Methylotenera sp.]MDO9206547.1 tyrosine-type recombinase/integrase [Methylotenera sp.]MDP3819804.1 tyrosine-type recombinase/integrase [Methylotenera sp.]
MGGIKQHGQGIQITFFWNGERFRPTLRIKSTVANLKYAERLKASVERSIALGEYSLEKYAKDFPTTRVAKAYPSQVKTVPTFKELSDTWLLTINILAAGSIANYKKMLAFWVAKIGDTPITDIQYSTLLSISNTQGWKAKYRNNMLIPMRRVFDLAFHDEIIEKNPADKIKNGKVQKVPPDPLKLSEVNLILEHMLKSYHAQVANYFEFAFFSGARPEEVIALKWSEVDFNDNTTRIMRVRTAGTDRESTKTSNIRDIELNSRALEALTKQKQHTFNESDYVFHNPVTNNRWNSEASQSRRYWNPSLKALGIRHRVQYQTRHTYATMNLMSGANPMWLAKMMGHTSMQMLLNVYAKWIVGADNNKERQKIESFFEDDSH